LRAAKAAADQSGKARGSGSKGVLPRGHAGHRQREGIEPAAQRSLAATGSRLEPPRARCAPAVPSAVDAMHIHLVDTFRIVAAGFPALPLSRALAALDAAHNEVAAPRTCQPKLLGCTCPPMRQPLSTLRQQPRLKLNTHSTGTKSVPVLPVDCRTHGPCVFQSPAEHPNLSTTTPDSPPNL
jgi:hypothetical protein